MSALAQIVMRRRACADGGSSSCVFPRVKGQRLPPGRQVRQVATVQAGQAATREILETRQVRGRGWSGMASTSHVAASTAGATLRFTLHDAHGAAILHDMIDRCEELADALDAERIAPDVLLREVAWLRLALDAHNRRDHSTREVVDPMASHSTTAAWRVGLTVTSYDLARGRYQLRRSARRRHRRIGHQRVRH